MYQIQIKYTCVLCIQKMLFLKSLPCNGKLQTIVGYKGCISLAEFQHWNNYSVHSSLIKLVEVDFIRSSQGWEYMYLETVENITKIPALLFYLR